MARKEVLIGLLSGLLTNFVGTSLCVLIISSFKNLSFVNTLSFYLNNNLLWMPLALGALPNLLVFFLFLKKDEERKAKGVLIATFLVLFFISKQKKGLLSWIITLFNKIKIKPKFLDKYKEKIVETDQHISLFYKKNRRAFLKSFFLYTLLIMLWTTEIHLGLIYIGITNITFINSFLYVTLPVYCYKMILIFYLIKFN